MTKFVVDDDVVKDDGVDLGSWKSIPKKTSSKGGLLKHISWNDKTKRDILKYYYIRHGNGTGEDFAEVAGEIATSVRRTYEVSMDSKAILKLLEEYMTDILKEIDLEKHEIYEPSERSNVEEDSALLDLKERRYPFKKGLNPLDDKVELCSFLNCKNLCFSSYKRRFFLACSTSDNLTEETCPLLKPLKGKEQAMFDMFKTQVNELKARKMILMTRKTK